jgi:hypothetical protein
MSDSFSPDHYIYPPEELSNSINKKVNKIRRVVYDNYPTPEPLAGAIAHRLTTNYGIKAGSTIIEPAYGSGNLVRALRFHSGPTSQIIGYDIRKDVPTLNNTITCTGIDWCTVEPNNIPNNTNLICTNPPYSIATKFVLHTLEIAPQDCVVAFLLRLSFLCGKERQKLIYSKYPLYELVPLIPRPSFTADGRSDASEYGLFIWVSGNLAPKGTLSQLLVWK